MRGRIRGWSATLYFDLVGFGELDSTVVIDNAWLIGAGSPEVVLSLDASSDSGRLGDNVTNVPVVDIVGLMEALLTVLLDVDGDGFDEGTTTSSPTGAFRFDDHGDGDFPARYAAADGHAGRPRSGFDGPCGSSGKGDRHRSS